MCPGVGTAGLNRPMWGQCYFQPRGAHLVLMLTLFPIIRVNLGQDWCKCLRRQQILERIKLRLPVRFANPMSKTINSERQFRSLASISLTEHQWPLQTPLTNLKPHRRQTLHLLPLQTENIPTLGYTNLRGKNVGDSESLVKSQTTTFSFALGYYSRSHAELQAFSWNQMSYKNQTWDAETVH